MQFTVPTPKRLRRSGFIAIAVSVLVCVWALVPSVRLATRTILLLPAFFVKLPVDPSGWAAGPVQRSQIEVADACNNAVIHIYHPNGVRRPALVISLGIDPVPPDDPSVVRLLTGLAHAGIVAALVESPALDAGQLDACAPDLLTQAYQSVAAQSFVDPRRVGFLGFSVGGSLALIAAANPQIRQQVRLVECFGAYDSLINLIEAAVTHHSMIDNHSADWRPDDLTVRMVRTNLIAGLPSESDRALLDRTLPDASSPEPVDVQSLSLEGQAVLTLLSAPDDASFRAALAGLPSSEQSILQALSPQLYLGAIQAPVYLLADSNDSYVPVT